MKKWEYRSEEADNDKLNKLGQEGWEAINVVTETHHDGYGNTFQAHWVLMKRCLEEDTPAFVIIQGAPPLPFDPDRCLFCGGYHGSGLGCPRMQPFATTGDTNG